MTLIERICAAEAGSRELDAEIAALIGAAYGPREQVDYEGRSVTYIDEIASPWTTSLDAAVALLPTEPYPDIRPGKWWWMLEVREGNCEAFIAYENHDAGIPEFSATASTPALAICAAAIQARTV